MSTYASILTEQALTIYVNGRARVMHRDNKSFPKVLEAYKAKDLDKAISLMDIAETVNKFGKGKITIEGGIVLFEGVPVHNLIADKILSMNDEGFDVTSMINFLENLMSNPSHRAVKELYLFLEHASLPITEDGHFLAYKKVREDFTDIHSGKFDNSPGQLVKMARNEVDDNRDNTCSDGLHFCSIGYLPNFSSYDGDNDKVVIVKINPANVVSIPRDYNNTKGRTCEYLVLELYTGPLHENIFKKSVWLSTDTFDHTQERAVEEFENEGGSSWDEHGEVAEEETVLDGGQLVFRDEEGKATATLDMDNFARKPTKVVKKAAKPVYSHLIGQVRQDEEGVVYKITGTERERGDKGSFTGKVRIHFMIISNPSPNPFVPGPGVTGDAPYEVVSTHKVVEHVNHPGAHLTPDHPEAPVVIPVTTFQQVIGQHIPPAVLAQASLEEDMAVLNKNHTPIVDEESSESFDEESFN